jgi:N-methylhydantoinase A
MRLIGVDIGGTFTDLILADSQQGRVLIHKVPTTAADPALGMVQGIVELCAQAGISPGDVDQVLHGTTIATNALLEHKGDEAGMITTEGYRDVIHIGRHQRPQHYSIMQEIPWQDRPLVKRRHRKVVPERIGPQGEVLTPLDEAALRQAALELKQAGVRSIAVCFLFSYVNDTHEERARALIREVYPEAFVTSSASIFPQFREFERFTTACINAFVGPKVGRYVESLVARLREAGVGPAPHLMRSNGGVATAEMAAEKPVTLLLSGPAAGVLGGAWVGAQSHRERLISFDVGGTSADIGIVTPRGFVEASARDTWIAGFPVMVPIIDIHTIGAGGGSIAYVDAGGAFRVGPRSAGSQPGPACYGRGGQEPTVSDANVVLGRLDPEFFLGGEMTLLPELAEQAVANLAERLGMSTQQAAAGILTIVNHNMANAIRSRTIQKGHDPRDFALVAFGGAGPLHAVDVARTLGIPEVIVPPFPGITSAMGLLTTDLKYDQIKNEFMLNTAPDIARLNTDLAALEASLRAQLEADGVAPAQIRVTRAADCRYVGQGYELRAAIPDGQLDEQSIAQIWQNFHNIHESEYGHKFLNNPIELVNLRVVGTGALPKIEPTSAPAEGSLEEATLKLGLSYFTQGGELTQMPTTCYRRDKLPAGATLSGPAVIFQKDSTTVLPPGSSATVDPSGSLIVQVGSERALAQQAEAVAVAK